MWRAVLFILLGCAGPPVAPRFPQSGLLLLRGATVVGRGPADVLLDGGRVIAVEPALTAPPDATVMDLHGRWLAPQVIDSHVHLAYLPVAGDLARHGVAGAVDLAAPLGFLDERHPGLEIVASGPMITAPGGYPLDSWGRDGYGLPCAGAADADAAVRELHRRGARLIKIPLGVSPELAPAALQAALFRAHALGMLVAVHALGDDAARRAAEAGADLLAHTPVEPLAPATAALWRGRAVISTLSAFGGASVENLALLRTQGARVLYGTDLGNTRDAGISERELALLAEAGLDPAAILASATSVPAELWGFDDLGTIAPGKAARLLLLDADPLLDPAVLATPSATLP